MTPKRSLSLGGIVFLLEAAEASVGMAARVVPAMAAAEFRMKFLREFVMIQVSFFLDCHRPMDTFRQKFHFANDLLKGGKLTTFIKKLTSNIPFTILFQTGTVLLVQFHRFVLY